MANSAFVRCLLTPPHCFVAGCVVLQIAYKANSNPYSVDPVVDPWFEPTILVFGSIHIVMSLLITLTFVINKWPRGDGAEKYAQIRTKTPQFLYYGVFSLFSGLGLTDNFFFALHLVMQVQSDPKLTRAMSAVTRNGGELASVFTFLIVLVYIFSAISFRHFRADYVTEDGQYCDTLYECFATNLVFGMTAGAGTREVLVRDRVLRGHHHDALHGRARHRGGWPHLLPRCSAAFFC